MKVSVIYFLEDTGIKVSGQKLVMQEFENLINKSIGDDRTLFFDKHVSNLSKKAGWKLSVLARLSSYTRL